MKNLLAVLFLVSALALIGCPEKTYNTTNTYKTKSTKLIYNDPISEPNPVPEPATLILVGGGLVGLAGWMRRRRR